jgi:predicted dehydrogenase
MGGESRRELRLAFIGAGEWVEKYHLPTIKRLSGRQIVSITGIWNRTRPKAEKLARDFDLPKVYEDLQEVIDDREVSCLAVAVNSRAVGQILRTLAIRELPLLCEKPPGADSAEARELAELITSTNVVAFNRRYMPVNQRFKEFVDGEQIEFVECSFYRRHRDVEEFITETGIHGINLLEYLFGEICKVETERWKVPGTSTYNWLAHLCFSSGLRGLLKFFPFSGINMEKVEVNGRDVTASVTAAHPLTDAREGFIRTERHDDNGEPVVQILDQKDLDPLCAGGFEGEYRDFLAALQENRRTLSNFQNAWQSVVIAEAVQNGGGVEISSLA